MDPAIDAALTRLRIRVADQTADLAAARAQIAAASTSTAEVVQAIDAILPPPPPDAQA